MGSRGFLWVRIMESQNVRVQIMGVTLVIPPQLYRHAFNFTQKETAQLKRERVSKLPYVRRICRIGKTKWSVMMEHSESSFKRFKL